MKKQMMIKDECDYFFFISQKYYFFAFFVKNTIFHQKKVATVGYTQTDWSAVQKIEQ